MAEHRGKGYAWGVLLVVCMLAGVISAASAAPDNTQDVWPLANNQLAMLIIDPIDGAVALGSSPMSYEEARRQEKERELLAQNDGQGVEGDSESPAAPDDQSDGTEEPVAPDEPALDEPSASVQDESMQEEPIAEETQIVEPTPVAPEASQPLDEVATLKARVAELEEQVAFMMQALRELTKILNEAVDVANQFKAKQPEPAVPARVQEDELAALEKDMAAVRLATKDARIAVLEARIVCLEAEIQLTRMREALQLRDRDQASEVASPASAEPEETAPPATDDAEKSGE